MPQVSWIKYDVVKHRHQIEVAGSPSHYDVMSQWCRDNTKYDFLQSFTGDFPDVTHIFRFQDPEDVMMFRLTFGGIYSVNQT